MRMHVWSAVGVVLLLAACGGPKPELPAPGERQGPDTSGIEITGDGPFSLVLTLYDSVIFSGLGSSETATLPSIIRESC